MITAFALVFALGVLVGLLAGRRWRTVLRIERDEARALVDQFNNSEARDDLATVGPVTGEHPPVSDDTGTGTVRHLRATQLYDQSGEQALCAWCPAVAVGRIDVTVGTDVWRNLPSCDDCPDLIRVGDLDPSTALPDHAAAAYGRRLG